MRMHTESLDPGLIVLAFAPALLLTILKGRHKKNRAQGAVFLWLR
jgi:hypothetical protein